MYNIRICKTPHNTINVFVLNVPNELKMLFGVLDIWAFNPNGRTGCDPYVAYEVDKSLKNYFKSETFMGMVARFGIRPEQVKIELN